MAFKTWPEVMVLKQAEDSDRIGIVTRKIQAVTEDKRGRCSVWVEGAQGKYDTFLVGENFGIVLEKLNRAFKEIHAQGRESREEGRGKREGEGKGEEEEGEKIKDSNEVTLFPSSSFSIFRNTEDLAKHLEEVFESKIKREKDSASSVPGKKFFVHRDYLDLLHRLIDLLLFHKRLIKEDFEGARRQIPALTGLFNYLKTFWSDLGNCE